jgi:dihydrodipicolinate synthase/N-acetylneuraminate lyase
VCDAVLDVGVGVLYPVRPDEYEAFDLVRVPPAPLTPAVQDSTESVELPPLVYNFSMLTSVDVSPALVGRLAAEHPNIVGIKDTVTEFSSYYAGTDVLSAA